MCAFSGSVVVKVGPASQCPTLVGFFCFMAQFRRPIFSAPQDIFFFNPSFSDDPRETQEIPAVVIDEVLLSAMLPPLAFCNLRCQVRKRISISDASEQAGASGEAVRFLPSLNVEVGLKVQDAQMSIL